MKKKENLQRFSRKLQFINFIVLSQLRSINQSLESCEGALIFWYQKEKGMFSSLQYFMVPYSAPIHEEVAHSSYVWQIFERYLLHCFTAFIKCNTKFSKGMSNIV